MILIIVALITTFIVVKLYVRKKYAYWKKFDVPFPKPSFIFGNVGEAFWLKKSMSQIVTNLYRNYEGYSYVGFYNFLTPAIVLRDPELINEVLIKNFDCFTDTLIRAADPIAGENPFFTKGEQWKQLRKKIAFQLSSVQLKYIYGHIENVCKQMIDYIKKVDSEIDLENFAYKFTGDNVMSCAYGLENKSFLNNESVLLNVHADFSRKSKNINMNHTIGFFLPNFSKLFNISYLGVQTPKLLSDTINMGVAKRIESKVTQKDFLNFLTELKNNNKTYLSHGVTFYIDGFETSAIVFTYLLLELAVNSDVQETAAQEVLEIYKKYNTIHSINAVKDLIYLEYVVLETLRKHTVIMFLNRQCTKDCIITHPKNPNESVFIKKGTQVFIPSAAIHRDPKFYANPKIFNPARFIDKYKFKKVFFGFGEGPRICPGQHFATTQLKMGVASILLHFVITLNKKTKFPLRKKIIHLSKIPINKILIDFTPRM